MDDSPSIPTTKQLKMWHYKKTTFYIAFQFIDEGQVCVSSLSDKLEK